MSSIRKDQRERGTGVLKDEENVASPEKDISSEKRTQAGAWR